MNQESLDLQPEPEYRTIPLTKGQITIVDAADYEWLMQWKWQARWSKFTNSYYAVRREHDATKRYRQREASMSREILRVDRGDVVDHKNRDTLDNRRQNLRICSYTQNACNRAKGRTNKSGFKGVSWKQFTNTGKWCAQIQVNGKNRHIGYFSTAESAHDSYKKAAEQLYGEFARFV